MNLYNKIKDKYVQCFKPGFKPAQLLGMNSDRIKMLRYYDGCKKIRSGVVRERKQLISQLPQIDNSLRIVPQDGYTTFNGLDYIKNVKEVIQKSKEIFEEYQEEAKEEFKEYQRIKSQGGATGSGEPKRYLLINVPLGDENLKLDSPFIKFALDPTLLSVIADYIGMVPVVYSMELYYSSPNCFDGEPKGSQCYHLDHEDAWSSKVFLFIDDVDEASGPFTMLRAVDSEKVCGQAKNFRITGNRHTDESIYNIISQDRAIQLKGPAGTIAVADTNRCFHFGGRAKDKHRLLLTIEYVTPFSMMLPWQYKKGLRFSNLATSQSSMYEKYALGAK
jgi:hypothetical protein